MNFIFISPHFPHTYWEFCDRLKRNGVNVLGVADAPYDTLSEPLRAALTEYFKVDNLEDYDQVYRAVAFLAFKYGKIDWIESNNEYWLGQDARLRTDFNVTTGIRTDHIMVAFGERRTPEGKPHYCAFASRRDIYHYQHSHEEVLARYGKAMVMCERMPEIFSAAMGNQMYTVKLDRFEDVQDFISFVHAKQA